MSLTRHPHTRWQLIHRGVSLACAVALVGSQTPLTHLAEAAEVNIDPPSGHLGNAFSGPSTASGRFLTRAVSTAAVTPPPPTPVRNPNYGANVASVAYNFQPELATGKATLTVPLITPSGLRGMNPQSTLAYQSDGGSSWVGHGWNVDLGAVQRHLKDGIPKYDTTDVFLLSFQGANSELVPIGVGDYRLKDEGAFLRIRSTPSGWEVWDKSGTKYTFGSNPSSQTNTPQGTFAWHLDRIEDVLGNYAQITYAQDGGATYLRQIRYAGNSVTGFVPPYRVEFITEPRPDVTTSYRIGALVTTSLRLARVEVYVGAELIRTYLFSYLASPDSGRSLLQRITQVGSDGASTLPPVTFSYATNPGGWREDATWLIPDGTFVRTNIDQGRRLADLDGDGRADLAVGKGTSTTPWELAAWVNTGSGWVRNSDLLLPTGLFMWENRDDGRYLVDLNGDGKPEALAAVSWSNGAFKSAYESLYGNGRWGWQSAPQWMLPDGYLVHSLSYIADQGRRFADFNGDARGDVMVGQNSVLRSYLNNGNGWTLNTTWQLPIGETFMSSDRDTGLRLVDVNSDGLSDLIRAADGTRTTYLNTGRGWQQDTNWNIPADTEIVTNGMPRGFAFVDLNADGQVDILFSDSGARFAYLNTGRGWLRTMSWNLPDGDLISGGNDQGRRLADLNGDGLLDVTIGLDAYQRAYVSTGRAPDLLTGIDNGLGGTTGVAYAPSTQYDNRGTDGIPKLPMVVQTVSAVTVGDGLGHSYTTSYTYKGGYFDPCLREFRGFREVTVTDAEGHVAITRFLQDDVFKGRPFEEEIRDRLGNRYRLVKHTWSSRVVVPGVTFAFLGDTLTTISDGNATSKTTKVEYRYDLYGNPTNVIEHGDTSLTGDERQTWTQYVYEPTRWIMDKPATRYVTNAGGATGTTVSQSWFFYDNHAASTDPPTQGLLTKHVHWLSGAAANPQTTLAYDAYGNVTSATNALGRATTTVYDPTLHIFPIQITNPLGHTVSATYDPKTGQVLTQTDPNGVTVRSVYDAFGRLLRAIGPNDSDALPTVRYAYDVSTVPAKTTVCARVQSGQAAELCTLTFADGMGRAVQTRSPAEDPAKHVVDGAVEFNSRGLVARQWVSYLSNTSASYVPLSAEPIAATLPFVTSTYDPLGRTVEVRQPDGSFSTTSYDDWTTSAIDANGHKTVSTADAFGRLAKVEEFTGSDGRSPRYPAVPYQLYATTTYRYDTLGNLTQVTDTAGHITRLTYDTLGRKLSMDDPDMGRWTYAYDAVGNLTSQTDARAVTTSFIYDALNRLTRKSYTIPAGSGVASTTTVTYTYDNPAKPFSKGKLTGIADGSGSSSFEYDNLGRLITEEKTINGTRYTIRRAYDLLGRVTSLTYPDGEMVRYTYNPQGGIESVSLQPVAGSPQPIVSNADYSANGQITKLAYGNSVATDYTYDALTFRLSHAVTQSPSYGRLQEFAYSFDPAGNVLGIQDAVHTATQSFGYDDINRLISASGAYGAFSYRYDPIGNMTEKEGVGMTYGLAGGAKPHAVTSTSSGLDLTYDANGNLLRKTDRTTATTVAQLAYDAENRLTQATTGSTTSQTATVSLSAGWNFFSLPVVPSSLSIAAVFGTQLSSVKQVSRFNAASGAWEHYVKQAAFDQFSSFEVGRGYAVYLTAPVTLTLSGTAVSGTVNLAAGKSLLGNPTSTARTVAQVLNNLVLGLDVTAAWRYNGAGFTVLSQADTVAVGQALVVQLSSTKTWTLPGATATTTQFIYDGDGGRVKQVSSSGTTKFLGASYEIAPDGTTTTYVVAGSQRIASKSSAGALRFYHGDHLGSSNVITDGTGSLVELAEYTPYGSLSRREGATNVPQKFTGQRLDVSTGLYFYHARYYDPQLGRFITADPTVQRPGDPQDLNRYSYCRNNPVTYVDPSGYGWFKKFWRAIVGVASTIASILVPPLAPALWALNFGISTYTAIQSGNAWVVVGGLVGGAVFGGIGQGFAGGMAASMGGLAQTFVGGALIGAAEFGLAGFGSGFGAALASGGSFRESFQAGGYGAAIGAGTGALIQGSYMAGWQGGLHGFDSTDLIRHDDIGANYGSGRFGLSRGGRRTVSGGSARTAFPPNRGFAGRPTRTILKPGTLIDRYGPQDGVFAAPAGTPFNQRGLPAGYANQPLNTYRVLKPLEVDAGRAANFGVGGGGTQYDFGSRTIQQLVDTGYLGPIDQR